MEPASLGRWRLAPKRKRLILAIVRGVVIALPAKVFPLEQQNEDHILGVAVGILTFIIGWSIPTPNFKSSCVRAIPQSKALSGWALLLSLQDRDLSKIEGEPKVQLETAIFSPDGELINSSGFDTGWRIGLSDIRFCEDLNYRG